MLHGGIKSFQNTYLFIFCALSNAGISFLKKQNIQGDTCEKRIFTSKIKEKHNFCFTDLAENLISSLPKQVE